MSGVPGPRFGERLLAWVNGPLYPGSAGDSAHDELYAIAAAIDQDARLHSAEIARLTREMWTTTHRAQVEQAVERLRYTVTSLEGEGGETFAVEPVVDVLDIEPFLAELDRIFGERQREPPSTA